MYALKSFAIEPLRLWLLALLLACAPLVSAQSDIAPPPQPLFSQQELDQMLAPIALYPDSLLSQIMMASTYPLEVVEASRWSRANPGLRGDDAVRAVENRDWDPSVKSLVAFPQILTMMDERLDWTKRLGDAFLSQQPQLMDTVQNLRRRAYAAGNLRSNEQLRVEQQGPTIIVEPAQPHIVYVPYYNPMVVYGSWWWPAPPVYWSPWPGYYARPGYVSAFVWGGGIPVSAGFFFGSFDWPRRHARVVNVNNYYYNNTVTVNRQTTINTASPAANTGAPAGGTAAVASASAVNAARTADAAPGSWRHDPTHRRGVPYRDAALREQFVPAGVARRDAFRQADPARPAMPAAEVSAQQNRASTVTVQPQPANAQQVRSVQPAPQPPQTASQQPQAVAPQPPRDAAALPSARDAANSRFERDANRNRRDARVERRDAAPQVPAAPDANRADNVRQERGRADFGNRDFSRPQVRSDTAVRTDARVPNPVESRPAPVMAAPPAPAATLPPVPTRPAPAQFERREVPAAAVVHAPPRVQAAPPAAAAPAPQPAPRPQNREAEHQRPPRQPNNG